MDTLSIHIEQVAAETLTLTARASDWRLEKSVSLSALIRSCRHGGRIAIMTCSCSEPGCAGIDKPILVRQTRSEILWIEGTYLPRAFRFQKGQYRQAVTLWIKLWT